MRARSKGFWRYELAGETMPARWEDWARSLLGESGEWIEYSDAGVGRYRGARPVDGRLQACLFVAAEPELLSRELLGSLFGQGALDDAARTSILAGRPANAEAAAGRSFVPASRSGALHSSGQFATSV